MARSIAWTAPPDTSPARLDVALANHIPGLSRSAAQRMIREGHVSVNGSVLRRPADNVGPGDQVSADLPGAGQGGVVAHPGQVNVVHEDEHLLVADKPAGIAVHPGAGHIDDTLVNTLLSAYPEMAAVGDPDRPGVVHRLDRDTSGLLVFARTQQAYEALVEMIKARDIRRTYTALVHGKLAPPQGVIDAPIGRDPAQRTRQAIVDSGKAARTRYRVVRHIGDTSLLEVTLETGRMHQVRVHMAGVGHPVVGDPVYGRRSPRPGGLTRQFLHASRLAFTHPVTGEPVDVSSPLPPDLQAALDEIEDRNH
ncbi:MAG: RluA family pseudouridine synthase [Dehalococcoidia bacterium]